MATKFTFRGKTLEELKGMDLKEFANLVSARARRSLNRGFTDAQKKFLDKVKNAKKTDRKKPLRTHCRDIIVMPEMLDLLILVYNGKTFVPVLITGEMLGHYLGEFALTRQRVSHSAPGIGATRSSASASVK